MRRKMKTSTKVTLIVLGVIVLAIVVLFNWSSIIYLISPSYEYLSNGYDTGSTMEIEGVVYEEINQDMFKKILNQLPSNQWHDSVIGTMVYNYASLSGEYIIYGNKDLQNRILLKGQSIVIVNDNIYPVLFFCRQDILDEYKETQKD